VIVPDWVARQAAARPEHPALVVDGRTTSYAALEHGVRTVAARLRALGIAPGKRVGAVLGNGPRLIELVHGCARCRVPLALFDPRLTPGEVAQLAVRAGVALVVAEDDTATHGRQAAQAAGALLFVVEGTGAEAPSVESFTDGVATIDLERPHTVVFTSGTTGAARPVVLTGANHLWSAFGSAEALGVQPDDRWLCCLPLAHVGGLAIVLRAAIFGATVVLERRFDAAAVAHALVGGCVSLASLVPTALGRVLDELDTMSTALGRKLDTKPTALGGELDIMPRAPGDRARTVPALRAVLIGGARSTPDLLARARASGLPVAPTYGLTEAASQVATLRPDRPLGPAGYVGHPLVATRVRIVRRDGSAAHADEAGEIQLTGPTITPGLLDRVAPEPVAFAGMRTDDGWLRTGDVGAIDESGGLTIVGRHDEVIVTGGENVAPEEVEAVLGHVRGVAEVAVAGAPDTEWGQVIVAWVVPRPGTSPPSLEEIRAACRGQLASHKLPRRLELVGALPRTALGKVKRSMLRAGMSHT